MRLRDLANNIKVKKMIEPQTNDTNELTSQVINTVGYGGCAVVLSVGNVETEDMKVKLQECNTNDGNFEDVEEIDIKNEHENSNILWGYTGEKKYIRVVTDDTGNADIAVNAILNRLHYNY